MLNSVKHTYLWTWQAMILNGFGFIHTNSSFQHLQQDGASDGAVSSPWLCLLFELIAIKHGQ